MLTGSINEQSLEVEKVELGFGEDIEGINFLLFGLRFIFLIFLLGLLLLGGFSFLLLLGGSSYLLLLDPSGLGVEEILSVVLLEFLQGSDVLEPLEDVGENLSGLFVELKSEEVDE